MEIWFQDAARYVCELLDEHLAALERRSQVQVSVHFNFPQKRC